MGKHQKLVEKLLLKPKVMPYQEIAAIFFGFGYIEKNNGRTSGSSVSFYNEETQAIFLMHKPHPQSEVKSYIIRRIIDHLEEHDLI